MIDLQLLDRLACPACRGALCTDTGELRCRECSRSFEVVDGIPVMLLEGPRMRDDIRISAGKWRRHWQGLDWDRARAEYGARNLPSIYRYLPPPRPGEWFLEIGSGPSFLTFEAASQGAAAVGLDLDLDVLREARRHFIGNGRVGHFVCASIDRLPFKPRVFSVSVGIGVLEHCGQIDESVAELARVTALGGATFQTVPLLSALTLITASLRYGTIPHVPVLDRLVRFMHITLLRTRRMAYGYEESFSLGFLRQLFIRAGFRQVEAEFYDYGQTLLRAVPAVGALFHGLLRVRILGTRPFGDVAYVRAVREE